MRKTAAASEMPYRYTSPLDHEPKPTANSPPTTCFPPACQVARSLHGWQNWRGDKFGVSSASGSEGESKTIE